MAPAEEWACLSCGAAGCEPGVGRALATRPCPSTHLPVPRARAERLHILMLFRLPPVLLVSVFTLFSFSLFLLSILRLHIPVLPPSFPR